MTVASGVALGAEIVAVAVAEDIDASEMLKTVIVDDEGDADGETDASNTDAAVVELDSSFGMNVPGLLEEAVKLEPFSSTVDAVVVVAAVVSFFAVVGKTEGRSGDVVCSSFEVDKLDTMEKILVRSFAGKDTLLVFSLVGIFVTTAVDEKLEVMPLSGTVAAELDTLTDVVSLLGTAEVVTTINVLFTAGMMELVMSLTAVDVEVVRPSAGTIEVGF